MFRWPLPAAPALAQSRQQQRERIQDIRAECREDRQRAMSQRQRQRIQRQCQREIRQTRRDYRQYRNHDYNRYEPGQRGYYADNYYRDGSYYQDRRLSVNDRVYRGQNGRYYCRRPDGTTGLIVGGLAGERPRGPVTTRGVPPAAAGPPPGRRSSAGSSAGSSAIDHAVP